MVMGFGMRSVKGRLGMHPFMPRPDGAGCFVALTRVVPRGPGAQTLAFRARFRQQPSSCDEGIRTTWFKVAFWAAYGGLPPRQHHGLIAGVSITMPRALSIK